MDTFADFISIHHICPDCKIYIGLETKTVQEDLLNDNELGSNSNNLDTEVEKTLYCSECKKYVSCKENREFGR